MEGAKLVKGVDAGGLRWYMDGKSVHAGTELEILLGLNYKYDPDSGLSPKVVDFEKVWIPVRLEFDYGKGVALAYWPVHEANMFSEVPETALFRWPGGSR